jgi:hypothetical protein
MSIQIKGNTVIYDDEVLRVSANTTDNRPAAPVVGMFRYNTTTSSFEGYDGTTWGTIGGSSAESYTSTSISSGVLNFDINLGPVYNVTLNENINSITFSNLYPVGKVSSVILSLTYNGTGYSITWPTSFKWPNNVAPSLTTTNLKKDIFTFFSSDGGITWNAFISGQNL